jgi:protein phosphatase 2C family protein 2/3
VQIDQLYYAEVSEQAGESAGTTALAAVVQGNTLYVANAGDSRAVLSRAGKAVQLSRDHKPQEPSEKQRIQVRGRGVQSGVVAVVVAGRAEAAASAPWL